MLLDLQHADLILRHSTTHVGAAIRRFQKDYSLYNEPYWAGDEQFKAWQLDHVCVVDRLSSTMIEQSFAGVREVPWEVWFRRVRFDEDGYIALFRYRADWNSRMHRVDQARALINVSYRPRYLRYRLFLRALRRRGVNSFWAQLWGRAAFKDSRFVFSSELISEVWNDILATRRRLFDNEMFTPADLALCKPFTCVGVVQQLPENSRYELTQAEWKRSWGDE